MQIEPKAAGTELLSSLLFFFSICFPKYKLHYNEETPFLGGCKRLQLCRKVNDVYIFSWHLIILSFY